MNVATEVAASTTSEKFLGAAVGEMVVSSVNPTNVHVTNQIRLKCHLEPILLKCFIIIRIILFVYRGHYYNYIPTIDVNKCCS